MNCLTLHKTTYYMKKYLLLMTSFGILSSAIAAPGDTTTVVFHDNEELSWYQAYDQMNTLPDGTESYNKIVLEFVLGKYACDGYDPSNPGEGANQTGWCADWDYDVHVQAINENDEMVDLGRLITPYANSNFPRTPADWSQSYLFDVTEYYPFLKDEMTLRIFYAGYSGGFTGTTKIHFIEGPRHRDVLDYEVLYMGSYAFGDATRPINDSLGQKTLDVPNTADHGEVKVIISGHGADPTNCAEFCSKYYIMNIDGTEHQHQVWRDDCGSNFLYPQSGTWIWDRANWCPGDQIAPIVHPFDPGNTTNLPIRMQFQDYTASSNAQASYKLSATAFFFSELHFEHDAGIEVILSPTIEDKYFRHNPSCGQSELRIKNYGSETITSLKIDYKVNATQGSYVWNGQIASLETQDIIIPLEDLTSGLDLTEEHTFEVEITEVNGVEDENTINNKQSTTFIATPKWDGGDYEIKLKTSSAFQGQVNKAYLKIYDNADQVIYEMSIAQSNTTLTEEIKLPNGCYRMEVSTPLGLGLRAFNFFMMNGRLDVKNLNTDQAVSLPKNDFFGSLRGNFGNGFTQFFEIVNSDYIVSVHEAKNDNKVTIYPNPADHILNVKFDGPLQEELTYKVYNILGQKVMEGKEYSNNFTISTEKLNSGNYFIEIQSNKHFETLKFNIKK